MNFLAVFLPIFLIAFLLVPFLCYFVRIRNDRLAKLCPPGSRCQRTRQRDRHRRQLQHFNGANFSGNDRQGNIFTISDETTGNASTNRYPDFFYLEPNSAEAARIRAQLEKDDKDLPSYDDVMRMTSLPTTPMTPPTQGLTQTTPPAPTTTPSAVTFSPAIGNTTSSTTISSSNSLTTPPAPPPSYSETPPSYEASSSSNANLAAAASTSRGAAIAIPITNSASNTIV